MGNSGSIHSIPSEVDDLHPYFKCSQGRLTDHTMLKWTQSYPDENYSRQQRQEHVKVLPNLNEDTLLRCTTNGAILQSGGTISCRKDSTIPGPYLQRSKTSINYNLSSKQNLGDFNKSQLKASFIQDHKLQDLLYKRSGSEPDLRVQSNHENMVTNQLRISKSQMVKNKKKKMMPSVPQEPHTFNRQPTRENILSNNTQQKKLRLFKTKAESKKPSVQQKFTTEASDLHFKRSKLDQVDQRIPEPPTTSAQRLLLKCSETKAPGNWQQPKIKALPFQGMRREKSFDLGLLTLHSNRIAEGTNENANDKCEVHANVDHKTTGDGKIVDTFRLTEGVQDRTANGKKPATRKYSHPIQLGCVDFKKELEEATKRRSLIVENVEKTDPSKNKKAEKDEEPANISNKYKASTTVDNTKRHPVRIKSPAGNPESKTSQLTKTFYFGMEGKTSTHHRNETEGFEKVQMDVIGEFSKSITTKPMERVAGSESSESALSSDEGYLISKTTELYEKDSDGGIHVHVRPTLPRRQFEIPRFSPAAAWRMLSDEQKEINFFGRNSSQNFDELPEARQPLEERIQRVYREANPIYVDNKSGDSGISGDAGLPERAESPRQNFMCAHDVEDPTQVSTTIKPWVPQQDLEEETSSDGDEVQIDGVHKYINQSYAFSLSLPRDGHLSTYEEKDKLDFSSLQKFKKTVSNVFFGTQDPVKTYCSDNWFLSRSAPNSIENPKLPIGSSHHVKPDKSGLEQKINAKPSSFNYFTGRRHVIYLPNHSFNEIEDDVHHLEKSDKALGRKYLAKNKSSEHRKDEQTSPHHAPLQTQVEQKLPISSNLDKGREYRFAFQSTVRQKERKRIAEKLSKEAEEKEVQRLNELEAMRKVEEEFQRKRMREKASIRHQLRLFSLEENQCASLPADWQVISYKSQRAEPDGAVSSSAPSPTAAGNLGNALYNKQENFEDMKSTRVPATEILSEYHTARKEYVEYRNNKRFDIRTDRKTGHPPAVGKIPYRSDELNTCDVDDNFCAKSNAILHNYRVNLARGRSISTSDSELSISSYEDIADRQRQFRCRSPSPSI